MKRPSGLDSADKAAALEKTSVLVACRPTRLALAQQPANRDVYSILACLFPARSDRFSGNSLYPRLFAEQRVALNLHASCIKGLPNQYFGKKTATNSN